MNKHPAATIFMDSRRSLWRIALLLGLFFAQFELIEIGMRSFYDKSSALASIWAPFFDYRHFFFSFIVVFPAALLMITLPRCRNHLTRLREATENHAWIPYLALQLTAYGVLLLLTYHISVNPEVFDGYNAAALALWGLSLLGVAISALLVLAPASFWRDLAAREGASIALAAATGLLATALYLWLQTVTSALAFGALHGTATLLTLLYDQPVLDIANRVVGTSDFAVLVSNDCAGYEGVTLITVFLSVYLWLFRKDFRFPQALIAFPVGIVAMLAFNVVRITALITIGDSLSPDVAMAGFHSNAGLIFFLVASMGLLWLLHRIPFFTHYRTPVIDKTIPDRAQTSVVDALLVPFAVLLAAILLVGALSAGFDQLYPLKVIATGVALWSFRGVYNFSKYRPDLHAIAVGILVFFVWMLLVSASTSQNAEYDTQFSQWPLWVTVSWIAFRFAGSVITVPLAEELAFRGYLLLRLGRQRPAINSDLHFNLLAFGVSSLLFGLMHGDWLAGTLAGMAYAWARYRRGLLGDAVIAHMVTNLLLSLYVLSTQQWAYW